MNEFSEPLIRAIETNRYAFFCYLARSSPELNLTFYPDVTIVSSAVPSSTFNYVFSASFVEGAVDRRIAEVIAVFKRAKVPFSWEVTVSETSKSLERRLLVSGMKMCQEFVGMSLDLTNGVPPLIDSNVHIQRAVTVDHFKSFGEINRHLGEEGTFEHIYRYWNEISEREKECCEVYLGYLDDIPVTCGMLFFHDDSAGIYYVATIPEYRGQGCATAVIAFLLQRAYLLDYRCAVLQSTAEGEGLYRSLGFTPYNLFREFTLS